MKPKAILEGEQLAAEWEYELKHWKDMFGGMPTALILSEDNSESYEMDRRHLFQLESGYAVVRESGCSCYETGDAQIELFPTWDRAKEAYDKIGE